MSRFLAVLRVGAIATVAAACGSSTIAPTTPPVRPAVITQTFSGTLAVQGASSHNFIVIVTGKIAVTLTSVGPPSVPIGVGLGVPSGLQCVLSFGQGSAATVEPGPSPQINGTALAGTFCVEVYDVGNLTAPTAYSVTVDHS